MTELRPSILVESDLAGGNPRIVSIDLDGMFASGMLYDDDGSMIRDTDADYGSPARAIGVWMRAHHDELMEHVTALHPPKRTLWQRIWDRRPWRNR